MRGSGKRNWTKKKKEKKKYKKKNKKKNEEMNDSLMGNEPDTLCDLCKYSV